MLLATISNYDKDSLTSFQWEMLGDALGEVIHDTMNTADSVAEIDELALIDIETSGALGPASLATRRHRRNTDSAAPVNVGVTLRMSTQGNATTYLRMGVEYNLVSAEFGGTTIKVLRMLPMYYAIFMTYQIGNGALNLTKFGGLALDVHLAATSEINPSDVTSVQIARTAADSSVAEFSYQLYVDDVAAYRVAQQITAQMTNRTVAGALDVNVCPSNVGVRPSGANCVTYFAVGSTASGAPDDPTLKAKKDKDEKVMSSSSWVLTLGVILAVLLCLLPVALFAALRKRRTEKRLQDELHAATAPTHAGAADGSAQSAMHFYPGAKIKDTRDPLPVDGEYMATESPVLSRKTSSDYLDPRDRVPGNGAQVDEYALPEDPKGLTLGTPALENADANGDGENSGMEFMKLKSDTDGSPLTEGANVELNGADFHEGFAATMKHNRQVPVDDTLPVQIAEKGEGEMGEGTTTTNTAPTTDPEPDDYINVGDVEAQVEYRELGAIGAVDYLEGPLSLSSLRSSTFTPAVATPVVSSPSKDGKKWWRRRSSSKQNQLDPLGLDQWSGQKLGGLSEADRQFVAATEALLDMDMDTETVGKLNLERPSSSFHGAHQAVEDTIAAKFVTPEYLASLSPSRQQQLLMCCHGSLHNATRKLGIHARSAADYKTYARIFANVIAEYYGLGGNFVHQNSWDIGRTAEGPGGPSLELLPATGIREATVKVKANRNFAGFPFVPAMTGQDRIDLENMMVDAFEDPALDVFQGGSIYSLTPGSKHFVDDDQYNRLTKQRLMFKTPATPVKGVVSDLTEDWPTGRCCFVSADTSILIWVGQEDHVRIIVQAKTTDYMAPYIRLQEIHRVVENKCVRFEKSPKFGHLTACPSKLGTAMSSQTCIDLPLLRDSDYNSAKEMCASRGVRLKRANAQHVYELSAEDGLCVTEGEMISNVWDAMVALSAEFRDQTKSKMSNARLS